MKRITSRSLHRQKGVASLLVSLIVLVTITFITFYTSRAVVMEQKMSTNDYRGRMAFEAAEAGIEATMAAVQQGWIITGQRDGDTDEFVLVTTNIVFDADNDGSAANNANTYDLDNGSFVTVTLTNNSTRDLIRLDVESEGQSDDRAATRKITQSIVAIPPVPNLPDAPLLSRTGVVVGGSAAIFNLEGHSTIWSGGDVSLGGNNATVTQVANPNDAHYPDCLGGSVQCGGVESSNREIAGLDIIESDSTLANLSEDEYFENFFGVPADVYKDSLADVVTTDLASQANPTGVGKVIWVDGSYTMQSNNVFGTTDQPSIVIVDGDLTLAGTTVFNGLLFVRGSIQGTGNVTVTGAMMVTGVSTSGGGLTVFFNSQVLDRTAKSSTPSGSSGSWRDF